MKLNVITRLIRSNNQLPNTDFDNLVDEFENSIGGVYFTNQGSNNMCDPIIIRESKLGNMLYDFYERHYPQTLIPDGVFKQSREVNYYEAN